MHVDNEDGTVLISGSYLREGPGDHLYLDILHELVHVRQQREGKDLYDRRLGYVDRPTEIEAYVVAVAEARRLGWDDGRIAEYLTVDWVRPADHRRLLRTLGVAPPDHPA